MPGKQDRKFNNQRRNPTGHRTKSRRPLKGIVGSRWVDVSGMRLAIGARQWRRVDH